MLKRNVFAFALCATMLAACGSQHNSQPVNTGDAEMEKNISALTKGDTRSGDELFVYGAGLRMRSSSDTSSSDNIIGTLEANDKVQVVSLNGSGDFVQIEVKSSSAVPVGTIGFASVKYLDKKPRQLTAEEVSSGQYFMVQNIATERVRVYERCTTSPGCPHKLVMETEVAMGEDTSDRRTFVGHYRISKWYKFYETGPYPAWYNPSYPAVPPPGSGRLTWFKSKYMPGGKGEARGAFGWYTAHVEPNASGQWTHGTMGWGADGNTFIAVTRGFWTNLFSDPRSHGCVRVENAGIAYLRQLLPVGTTVLRIYAKEGLRDASLSRYPETSKPWSWILTTNGYGQTQHQKADANEVLSAGTPNSQVIDRGTYNVDIHPDVYDGGNDRGASKSGGNLYGIPAGNFRGVFLVDEGVLVDYQHPAGLTRGGYSDVLVPGYMISNDQNYVIPKPVRQPSNGGGNYSSGTPFGESGSFYGN